MPHRLTPWRAKVQFITYAAMPSQIHQAAEKTGCLGPGGKPSNTLYIQKALCRALARDLGLRYDDLLDDLPHPDGAATWTPPRRTSAKQD